MDKENKEIGRRIKEVRESLGLTQEELGQKLGVEKASISKYEAGGAKRGVPVASLLKIAEIGGVSLDELSGNESLKAPGHGRSVQSSAAWSVDATVNEGPGEYGGRTLKLTRQEEEVIYWLRTMPHKFREIAVDGLHAAWFKANRMSKTEKDSE